MDQNSSRYVVIHFLECVNDRDPATLKDLELSVKRELLSLALVNNFMANKVGRNYRLYNFNGLEIMDFSDIERYSMRNERNNVIFFTKQDEKFETKNILRVFKSLKKLGEGGFGAVYLAEQIYTKEKYAIKYLKSSSAKDYSFLYKEIEALKRLDHNNVIKLINYCVLEDNKLVFVLEYVSGGSLKGGQIINLEYLLQKKKLPEEEARLIFSQLVETVQYCHRQKIIHRDLKPENILFTNETKSSIKVIDFGLAGVIKDDKSTSGSIRYISPEVLTGANREALPSIDIWSLGCILFELLTGKHLFDGKNRNEIRDKVVQGNYELQGDMSPEAFNLLEQMLKVKIAERIAISQVIRHPWVKGEKLITIESTESSGRERTKKKSASTLFLKKVEQPTKVRSDKRTLTTSTKDTSTLPALITKVAEKSPISLVKELSSNVPNYLKPIGHDRKQKRNMTKLKNYFERINELNLNTLEKESNNFTLNSSNINATKGLELKLNNSIEPVLKTNILRTPHTEKKVTPKSQTSLIKSLGNTKAIVKDSKIVRLK